MFRASDIFGRKPGSALERPVVQVKPEPAAIVSGGVSSSSTGAHNRVWDPATGKFYEEDVPQDIQEMMARKRAKVEHTEVRRPPAKVLGPAALGLAAGRPGAGAAAGPSFRTAPSVEFRGFSKAELDDRFYERAEVVVHDRSTYWTNDGQFFIYWQGEAGRWSICDATSFPIVRAGQLPGWAYKEDDKGFCQATGWMEFWENQWRAPALEVTCRSVAHHRPQWEDATVQAGATDGGGLAEPVAAEDPYAHLEKAEVPHLKAKEYAVLVQAVYEQRNPSKLQDMARLLQKYKQRERELYLEVCKKYGEHPAKFHARYMDEQAAADEGEQMADPASA